MKKKEKSMDDEVRAELLMAEISNLLEKSRVTNQDVLAIGFALISSVVSNVAASHTEKGAALEFASDISKALKERLEQVVSKPQRRTMGEA